MPRAILLFLAICLAVGCEPRGESRSLDEIFASERQAFLEAKRSNTLAPEISETLDKLEAVIEAASSRTGPGHGAEAAEAASLLSDLVPQTPFTVRPALGELAGEIRAFGGQAGADDAARWKLLSARTYSALAQAVSASP